jgi:hypothetical protein
MNRGVIFSLLPMAAVGIALFPGSAVGQQKALKDQLVGTWTYVSSTSTRADGTKAERPNLKGMVIYTSDGHFHLSM